MYWREYYRLTKPGIIYGNLMLATAGYLLASGWRLQAGQFISLLAGTSLVIGGACVYNNCLDRNIDRRMKRTRQRALVTGAISLPAALVFASGLTAGGFALLSVGVNWLVVAIGAVGFVDYVVAYGLAKRRSAWGTIVGSVSGATPLVAGYCAAVPHIDRSAGLLFAIMVLWQLPHFYAIALYRRQDYAAARVPVLTTSRPAGTVKLRMLAYILLFGGACGLLSIFGATGIVFAAAMAGLSLLWFWQGLKYYRRLDPVRWGRRLFIYSLVVITGLSAAVSVGGLLP